MLSNTMIALQCGNYDKLCHQSISIMPVIKEIFDTIVTLVFFLHAIWEWLSRLKFYLDK